MIRHPHASLSVLIYMYVCMIVKPSKCLSLFPPVKGLSCPFDVLPFPSPSGCVMNAFHENPNDSVIALAPPPAPPLHLIRVIGRISRLVYSGLAPGESSSSEGSAGPVIDYSSGRACFELEDGSGLVDCEWLLGDDVTPYKQRLVEVWKRAGGAEACRPLSLGSGYSHTLYRLNPHRLVFIWGVAVRQQAVGMQRSVRLWGGEGMVCGRERELLL